jgi:DNA-binding LacI/PurR family transcriptional regulator
MRDVAIAAQVGVATVSRVLSDSPLVAMETAAHVRRAITQCGYDAGLLQKRRGRPKKLNGSGLKHGVICMLFTGQQNLRWMTNCAPVYAYAVQSAEMALNKRGISCIIRHIPTAMEAHPAHGGHRVVGRGGFPAQDPFVLRKYRGDGRHGGKPHA